MVAAAFFIYPELIISYTTSRLYYLPLVWLLYIVSFILDPDAPPLDVRCRSIYQKALIGLKILLDELSRCRGYNTSFTTLCGVKRERAAQPLLNSPLLLYCGLLAFLDTVDIRDVAVVYI